MEKNPRHPHRALIKREDMSDPFNPAGNEIIIYDGVCRSYQRNIVTPKGEILNNVRTLSIPIKRDDWNVIPIEGDYVEVHIGSIIEWGHIIDKQVHNLGTDLTWSFGRN